MRFSHLELAVCCMRLIRQLERDRERGRARARRINQLNYKAIEICVCVPYASIKNNCVAINNRLSAVDCRSEHANGHRVNTANNVARPTCLGQFARPASVCRRLLLLLSRPLAQLQPQTATLTSALAMALDLVVAPSRRLCLEQLHAAHVLSKLKDDKST